MNNSIQPFNNHVEYGLRALIILKQIYPGRCDLSHISCLDYLVVHSGDFNSSLKSIHAPTPNRKEEIYIRRSLFEEALKLLSRYCLVKPVFLAEGIYYEITDEGEPFLDSLSEEYTALVDERAAWAVKEYGDMDVDSLRRTIKESIGSISSEIAFHIDFSKEQ